MTVAINRMSPEFKIDGTLMPENWANELIGMRIERGLSVVGRAVLRFIDVGYQLSATMIFKLGTSVDIAISQGDKLMSGVVTGASLEHRANDHPELVVTIDDAACKLGMNTKVVVYEKQKFGDIVSKMASAAGLRASTNFGPMQGVVHDYLLQRSTDLVFLDTLVRRANCVWWVDEKMLYVGPSATGRTQASLELGTDLLDFSVRASGLRPVKVQASGWDIAQKADITSQARPPAQTATSSFVDGYTGTGPQKGLGVAGQQQVGDGNPNDAGEATALADSMATDWHSSAVVARGTVFANPSIMPSVKVQVTNAGPSSGTYLVSEVEHILRSDGFFTKFVAGPVRPSRLVDTLGGDGPDSGFTMPSLMTALVSDVKDPKKYGRVKVKYTGAGGELASNWARVMSMGGGNKRGAVFQPEVNDEVLVGFERGDSRHPVVIGGLFSPKAQLAADDSINAADGTIAYRRITSRLGHTVELADGSAATQQHILLKLSNNTHKLRLGADGFSLEVDAGKPLSIKAGKAKFEIDAQGNITIEGTSISLKSTAQNVAIEGTAKVTVKANAGVDVSAPMVDIKADGNASLQGNGMTTIKGGVVMIN